MPLTKDKDDVLTRIRSGKLWHFMGGIHPPEMKQSSNQKPIRRLHLPKYFYVPVLQHVGEAGRLIVTVGEKVLKGQPLTKGEHYCQLPVHSPTSGKIVAIEPHIACHPSGLSELTVIIETDGKEQWIERHPIEDFLTLTAEQIIEKVYHAGIAGLGGAVFPTSSKLHYADKRCKLLIINGVECEPYITCDDRLMQDYTAELLEGIRILRYVLRPEEVVIAIEDNKPHAINALNQALNGANDMFVRVIPTKYPSGASDQLVKILTGLEVPQNKRTIELGIVMHNVGTAFAVKRAVIDDEPLIERVVTLTGDKIRNKGNVWVRLGTPIIHLLEQVDYQMDARFPVFLGGPMMGFILPSLQVPITKTANCIIAPDHFEYTQPKAERNCIRCSACSDACPVGLLPQQLYWFARVEDHEKSQQYHLNACIECGICAYVCPSYIPLVQYFRQEKATLKALAQEAQLAEEAKLRFEARELRLNQEKEARHNRIQQVAAQRRAEVAQQQGEDPVQAALARLRAKGQDSPPTQILPSHDELMAQRRARRIAKQSESSLSPEAHLTHLQAVGSAQNLVHSASSQEKVAYHHNEKSFDENKPQEIDPRKAAVVAALARAKAKKLAQSQPAENQTQETHLQAVGSAQNLVHSASSQEKVAYHHNEKSFDEDKPQEIDPRKAAVAAALARAKAKKLAQMAQEKSDPER